MKKLVIYKVTNKINGKIYIGQTQDFLKRQCARKIGAESGKKKSYFDLAIIKYGWENFIWEIIEECQSNLELDEREKYWIRFYQSQNKNFGYNLADGGKTSRGSRRTSEQKLKFSLIFKEKYKNGEIGGLNRGMTTEQLLKSLETRRRRYLDGKYSRTHKKFSEESKDKMSKIIKKQYKNGERTPYWLNKPRSEKTKLKIKKTLLGSKHKTTQRKVVCITTGIVYESISEAARQNNISQSGISYALRSKYGYFKKLYWKYFDNIPTKSNGCIIN